MADDNEFGEFSSIGEEWTEQNHLTPSFSPNWLAYSDNQDWVGGVIPNNEQSSWNASFPELPKELSNLLSDDSTNSGDADALGSNIAKLPINGSGHEADEFGDFECSLDIPEVAMATNHPINAPASTHYSNIDTSLINDKPESWPTPVVNLTVEDDEFGDFEGSSIPSQPYTAESNVVFSEVKDQVKDEDTFGGFVSTSAEIKEKATADDDFGSFEATEFVSASSFPPLQAGLPTNSTVGATPSNCGAVATNKPPSSFSTVAESCFYCSDQTGPPQSTTDHQSLNTMTKQSSLWSSLQSSMKTTSPLYAWSKSHVEDQYFAALKVDPMLVYTILSFAEEMGMAPLAPQDQLLAGDGFQWPDSPTEERQPQEVAATLLDLTLSSPVTATPSKAMSRHESFTLDADLMGLDFTLTDDPQPTTAVGEEPPVPMVTETSSSKTADAIADMLGLSTNPYLTNKEDKSNQSAKGDGENVLCTTGAFTSEPSPPTNTLSLSQPLESLMVSKDELQSIMPSQETLDALTVAPSILQSLTESDSKTASDVDQPAALSSTVQDLLSSLPALPESNQPLVLSSAAQDLLSSLPDVTFMLYNTHTKHT